MGLRTSRASAGTVCCVAGAARLALCRCQALGALVGTGESTMDTLLIILLALTTLAIPALTETAAATHIFDAWARAGSA